MSHNYTYEIDGIVHKIKSIDPMKTADSNGVIPISSQQNLICKKLKFLLQEWIRVAEKNNIHWFCNGGTLLGAIRDKGLIHYDNDIDLVLLAKDFSKIGQLTSDTCVIDAVEQGFQFHLKNEAFPFIDLWLVSPNPENPDEHILAGPIVNDRCYYIYNSFWPNEKYATSDIMNVSKLPFENIMIHVPSNYERYIKQMYGPDCLDRYVIQEHTDNHTFVNTIPDPKTRMLFWSEFEKLLKMMGGDTCKNVNGKESTVLISLIAIEFFTPEKNKMKRKFDLIYNYVSEKAKSS